MTELEYLYHRVFAFIVAAFFLFCIFYAFIVCVDLYFTNEQNYFCPHVKIVERK